MIPGTVARVVTVPLRFAPLVTATPRATADEISPVAMAGNRAVAVVDAAIESGCQTTLSDVGGVCRRSPTRPTICTVRTESPITRFSAVTVTPLPGTVVTT